jgi:hypothetical protein
MLLRWLTGEAKHNRKETGSGVALFISIVREEISMRFGRVSPCGLAREELDRFTA